jgi:superfamily II DNA or RNA helicase
MEGLYGPVIDSFTMEEAIDKKVIAEPTITLLCPEFPDKVFDINKYQEIYKLGIVENELRNQLIIDEAKKRIAQGKSCLIMIKETQHGHNLNDIANSKDFIFIHGVTLLKLREKVREALENKKIKGVIVSDIWSEGVNIKSLNCVFIAKGGKSEIKTLQNIGRGTRIADDKDSVEIIDFLDTPKYLSQHSISRIRTYKKQNWKIG